ncbi:MAG: uroporphyrinogen-III C-methyltransferase [Lentisphaerales bacterium]|nr:MAG: uroporphyrinogen-III C-methyltransferase [Lentisphaerales bacterium]
MAGTGIVYLVGAGPGDPDLLTIRGRDCLALADVVVYDSLANPVLLDYAPEAAERIYVGKQASSHAMEQDDINQLLADKAGEGKTVIRLKGGDPYVFGRGAEEALVLRKEGIPFEVVPGVTAGIAAPAYAGIPVTHRECSSVITLVTGHEDPTKTESSIDWSSLAAGTGTLVFYMGMKNLPAIASRLIEAGRSPTTPTAVIHRGTCPAQRVVEGTLENIVQRVKDAGLTPPVIILVGQVASLRSELAWFENRPLFGKTILVTRSRTQASEFAKQLQKQGAEVISFPTIRIVPPDSMEPLHAAVERLKDFDWVVFASVNAIDSFFKAVDEKGLDGRSLAGCLVCAIGSATCDRLRERGIEADMVPGRSTSRDIFDALLERDAIKGKHFFLPRPDIAPPELPDKLRNAGGTVTEVEAYRTLPADPDPAVLERLRTGDVDIVTFTSSSTARNYASLVRAGLGSLPSNITYVSIGPETTKAAIAEGMTIAVEAEQHDIDGLVAAITHELGSRQS